MHILKVVMRRCSKRFNEKKFYEKVQREETLDNVENHPDQIIRAERGTQKKGLTIH